MCLLTLIREAAICNIWWLTEKHRTGQSSDKRLWSARVQMGHWYHILICKGSGIIMEEGKEWMSGAVNDYTETASSRYSRAATHMNPQWLWQQAQLPCKHKPNKIASCMREVGRVVLLLLAKGLLVIDRCWERKSIYFKNVPPGKLTMLQWKASYPKLNWEHKLELIGKGNKIGWVVKRG